jgi:hypothetical protein
MVSRREQRTIWAASPTSSFFWRHGHHRGYTIAIKTSDVVDQVLIEA